MKLKTMLGKVAYAVFPQLKFRRFHGQKCRIANDAIIVNSKLGTGVKIDENAKAFNSTLCDYTNLAHNASVNLSTIEKRSSIGRYSIVADVDMGAYCSVSWLVTIGAGPHPIDTISSHFFNYYPKFGIVEEINPLEYPRTTIGNDVWIGAGSIIKGGVRIGDGAVIGSGAVVTHDVEPYAIVAGVPARVIKYRFDEQTRERLLKIKWWDFDDATLKNIIDLFNKPLDEDILQQLEKLRESL